MYMLEILCQENSVKSLMVRVVVVNGNSKSVQINSLEIEMLNCRLPGKRTPSNQSVKIKLM